MTKEELEFVKRIIHSYTTVVAYLANNEEALAGIELVKANRLVKELLKNNS